MGFWKASEDGFYLVFPRKGKTGFWVQEVGKPAKASLCLSRGPKWEKMERGVDSFSIPFPFNLPLKGPL